MSRNRWIVVGLLLVAIAVVAVVLVIAARGRDRDDGAGPPPNTAPTASSEPGAGGTTTTASTTPLGPMSFTDEVVDADGAGDCKALGDIDGDGAADGVVGGRSLAWYHFGPDPAQPPTRLVIRPQAQSEYSTDCQLADVDGDGDLDLVVPDERRLLWYENPRPDGDVVADEWAETQIGEADGWTHDVEVVDVDADGRLDVVTRRQGGTDLWLQQRDPGGWARTTISGQGGEGTAVGDVDGDGDLDVVAGGTWLEHPDGDPAGSDWAAHPIDAIAAGPIPVDDLTWGSVEVADVDADGRDDVVYGPMEQTGSKLAWYSTSDGAATWTEHLISTEPIAAGFHTFQVADVDGDGDLDLVTARMHSQQPSTVSVWVNEGGGDTWREEVLGDSGLHNLRVGDVDGDGDLDVFGSNYVDNPPVRLYRNQAAGGSPTG